jgi:hypothetical protein
MSHLNRRHFLGSTAAGGLAEAQDGSAAPEVEPRGLEEWS